MTNSKTENTSIINQVMVCLFREKLEKYLKQNKVCEKKIFFNFFKVISTPNLGLELTTPRPGVSCSTT